MAKASDTVINKISLDKHFCHGIGGNTHKLMVSFFTNRQQKVEINNEISEYNDIPIGISLGNNTPYLMQITQQ